MNSENALRDLIQQKRTYESLLALNSAGRFKSDAVKTMLTSQLRKVELEISLLRKDEC